MGVLARWIKRNSTRTYFDPERITELLGTIFLHGLRWPGIEVSWPETDEGKFLFHQPRSKQTGVCFYSPMNESGERKKLQWRYATMHAMGGVAHFLEGRGFLIDKSDTSIEQEWRESIDLAHSDGIVASRVLQATQGRFDPEKDWQWKRTND